MRNANRFAALLRPHGVGAAMAAAVLFGASTPLSKLLLQSVDPWLLAGLLYLGSGIALGLYRVLGKRSEVRQLSPGEWPWLAGAVVSGGIVAPVLLMYGVIHIPGSTASLLLNAEGVFTALLAWFVFRENFDRRIAAGRVAIVLGAVLLSWSDDLHAASLFATRMRIIGTITEGQHPPRSLQSNVSTTSTP